MSSFINLGFSVKAMKRKIYAIIEDLVDESKVWIDEDKIPRELLKLKLIAEKEIPVLSNNISDLINSKNYNIELETPENANAFETIRKEKYSKYGGNFRKGIYNHPCMGEIPCFFVLARYYSMNEKSYKKFVEKK